MRDRARVLTAALPLALLVAVGCGRSFVHPDPRDFAITNLPPASPDVGSSAVVASAEPPPRGPEPAGPRPGEKPGKPAPGVLELPPDLPGAAAPPLELPKLAGMNAEERAAALRGRFPTLPPLTPEPAPAPSPTGKPLTLAELEQMALTNSPVVKQAAADVEAARGQAVQAGLLPNPEVGYQVDQLNSGRGYSSRGQQGGYVSWLVKTAGKLRLARLVEMMNYLNAEVALRRAQVDVVTQVRQTYFAVLVARQGITVYRALATFSADIYRAQLGLVQAGEQAGYEPLQSYVLAVQARGNLVQSRNRYLSAWRQLAATLNRPDLPVTELAGRADAPAPDYLFEQLRDIMLANHTDVATAQNAILRERYRLQLAKVTAIPDIKTYFYIEKDWSTPPFNTQVGIQAGGAIPVFDRNQGGRLNAQATLARALLDVSRVQNDLSARLAQAWESYANNKVLVEFYRTQAIPNQVRVYRATYRRYQQDNAGVNYNDVVLAQQTLAGLLTSYLTTLSAQWQAVADIAALTQQPEIYPGGEMPPPVAPLDPLLDPDAPPPQTPADQPPPKAGDGLPPPRPQPDAKKE